MAVVVAGLAIVVAAFGVETAAVRGRDIRKGGHDGKGYGRHEAES